MSMSDENQQLLDAHAVARLLNVKLQWVRDHTTRMRPILPHTHIGTRTVRYERAEILRFIAERREDRHRSERDNRRRLERVEAAKRA